MDRSRFRKRVLIDLLSAPLTLIPAALGGSLLVISWALERGSGWMALLGIAGLLAGAGTLFTRWIFHSDEIARAAFADLQDEMLDQRRRKLDQLDKQLQKDEDPRTEQFLRNLRKLYNGFRADSRWSENLSARNALEIVNQVEKLFKACIMSLERSLVLWETAGKMATAEGRRNVMQARDQLLGEIQASIDQLARTIDDVQALSVLKQEDHNLAHIREELNASLEVARRVEERMDSLEAELGRVGDRRLE